MRGRLLRRGAAVLANTGHTLVPPFFGFVLSWLVIRVTSAELWGRFVSLWIFVQLAVHIAAWGNKEYLLRELSRAPRRLAAAWWRCLATRLAPFALLWVAVLAAPLSPLERLLLPLWGLALVLHQSFEVLVLYRRLFVPALLVEAIGFAVAASAIGAVGARLTIDALVVVMLASAACRAAGLAVLFRADIRPSHAAPSGRRRSLLDPAYFRRALPFFVLGFSGMLMSRTDLYCVALLLDRPVVGAYQVLAGFVVYLQSVSLFVLAPFLKGLYRLPEESLRTVARRLPVLGAAVVLPGAAAVLLLLHGAYGLALGVDVVAVGCLSALPIFAYLPLIYLAYRRGRESFVVWVNVAGIVANLALNLALLPVIGLLGAVIGSAAAQTLMLAIYVAWSRAAAATPVPGS